MRDIATLAVSEAPSGAAALQGALLDSRQRLRDLVLLAADFAFETDAMGRFVFLIPDRVLGWDSAALIGQPAAMLIDAASPDPVVPFHHAFEIRQHRSWIRCADGGSACVSFGCAPLFTADGRLAGTRGAGTDVTAQDRQDSQMSAALRRGEALDHILRRVDREVLAPRMLRAALDALVSSLGAEGASVIEVESETGRPALLHHAGTGAAAVLDEAAVLLQQPQQDRSPWIGTAAGHRPLAVVECQTRIGGRCALALWRGQGGRAWDDDDRLLIASSVRLIHFALEHEALQREMTRQARTDPLTGLLNRRAFQDELDRQIERLDRDGLPGTMLFADLDNFKPVNDQLGHEAGDEVLVCAAKLFRDAFRPSDLVARLGGDEFAVWLSGADQMTAAERAEDLCARAGQVLAEAVRPGAPRMSLAIGIATRQSGSGEPVDEVIRRADEAMYEVKRAGRGHWRVAREDQMP